MIFVAMTVIILSFLRMGPFATSEENTIIFVDGVSAPIPLLRLFGFKVIFYCHFPDLLLCYERSSPMKKVYRLLIDSIEEITTGCANITLVNSKFTREVFKTTFKTLGTRRPPFVLYPTVPEAEDTAKEEISCIPYANGFDSIFVSLNRYERKKNISLAIDSFVHLIQEVKRNQKSGVSERLLLVVAGGYDRSVMENVQYLEELMEHCKSHHLPFQYQNLTWSPHMKDSSDMIDINGQGLVVFRTSISKDERTALLATATCLLYTPDKEHFGIVPLEAMCLGVPVVAVNSGGPTETVINQQTGFLCDSDAISFSTAMFRLVQEDDLLQKMRIASKKHIEVAQSNKM